MFFTSLASNYNFITKSTPITIAATALMTREYLNG